VVVKTVHPIAVIEKHCYATSTVRKKPMKPSVQAFWEGGILLVKMNKIRGSIRRELMTSLSKSSINIRLWIFLPGKDEHDLSVFIHGRHSVRERVLTRSPPDVDAGCLINPCPGNIESFMPQDCKHA
jgi:hypothetical protein